MRESDPGRKPTTRHEQQRGIELRRPVGLNESIFPLVECACADLLVDGIANAFPLCHRRFELALIGKQDGAIEGNPRHHLGVGKLLRPAARFPYAFIGLSPDRLKMSQQLVQDAEIVFLVMTTMLTCE